MDTPDEVSALIAELEEQVRELRECSSNFLDAGLVGHHQTSEAELESVLQTLQNLRLLTGDTEVSSALQEPKGTDVSQGSGEPGELDTARTPQPGTLQPAGSSLRWGVAQKVHNLQLEVKVPPGTRASGISVEQGDTAVAVQVGNGEEREIKLPPAAAPDSMWVKLLRREGILRIQVELQELPALGEQMDLWAGQPQGPSEPSEPPRETPTGRGLALQLQAMGYAIVDSFMTQAQALALRQQHLLDLHAGNLCLEPSPSTDGKSTPGSAGVHRMTDATYEAEGSLWEVSQALDRLVAATAPHLSSSSSLMREHFRVSAFGAGVERLAPAEVSRATTRDSGMPRVLGATLFLAGSRSAGEAAGSGDGPNALFNRLVLFPVGSRLAQELTSDPKGQPCLMLTTWYSDSSRLADCETDLQGQVQAAWDAVTTGSVAVYQEQLEQNPADINTRWKVIQMFLDHEKLPEAKQTAQVGLETNPEHPLAWVMAGVVRQHEAAASGGPSTDAGQGGSQRLARLTTAVGAVAAIAAEACWLPCYRQRALLHGAADYYRKALARDERHPDALRNMLVCLEHLVELEELHGLATKAIKYGVVKYRHPMQRPTVFVPGLCSQPWWDAAKISFVKRLEAASSVIRAEALALVNAAGPEGHLLGHCDWQKAGEPGWRQTDAGRAGWRKVLRRGRWNELVLWGGGKRVRENCELVPRTAEVMDSIPEAVELAKAKGGEVLLSVLTPGTHIRAHCGPSNNRLTCHLGLDIPPGLSIRVDQDTRVWQEGRCIVFDDSFEHEVRHKGDRRRIVLMFNFWHPDITEAQKASSMEEFFAGSL